MVPFASGSHLAAAARQIYGLREHLAHLIDHHVAHVKQWLKLNTNHFQAKNASMEELSQAFSSAVISLRANVQLRNVPSVSFIVCRVAFMKATTIA
jgi:hypothetical protein